MRRISKLCLPPALATPRSFTSVRFFSNQQTVKASGVDVVATLPFELGDGTSTLTAVAISRDIELSKFDPNFTSDNRRRQIENGPPRHAFCRDLDAPARAVAVHGQGDATTATITMRRPMMRRCPITPDPDFVVILRLRSMSAIR